MENMFKRMSTLALSVALTSSMVLPALAFNDTTGHWAQQSINELSQRGVITGYPSGEFRPEGLVTRAEFASMLVKAQGLQNSYVDNGSNFVDVPRNFWGYRAIETVSDNGLVSGYPGGYFRPNQSISRAEAMAILVNASRVPLPSQAEASQILRNYGDAAQVPQWAERSVAAAIQSGIFANYPNASLIEPNQAATRAEIAVMTDNMGDYLAGRNNNQPPIATGGTTGGTTTGSIGMNNPTTIQGRVSVVPASTTFGGVVTTPFSSDRNKIGDQVVVTLDRPLLSAAGDIVVPQGSQVIGAITSIDPAGRLEKNAGVGIDFNRVITPDGRTFAVSAEVNTENGILKGGTTKGRLGRVAGRSAGGAAIGGAAGAILGAIKGDGKADDYALRGAVLGGATGAGSALISRGNEVVLQAGDKLDIRLRQPLTVTTP